ncbi:MAG TPA: cell envelope integrity protein CreD [Vicinamibacterales bacterium]|jgi:inner membrane protein|nr:cell envelope integrity protein CreD [Vicinamibacterales bacterium]
MPDYIEPPPIQFRALRSLRESTTLRLLSVGLLVLLLQIPIVMIGSLVQERQARRDAAIADVSSKWGNSQTIVGPALVLPYTAHVVETTPNGTRVPRVETRAAVFLPNRLHARGAVDAENRSRGIFSIPVYRLRLIVDGEFDRVAPSDAGVAAEDVAWTAAHLVVGMSDVRVQEQTTVTWNGTPTPFEPGVGRFAEAQAGIHANVAADESTARYAFSFPLAVNGSVSLAMVPFARQTDVELTSNSPHPNFQGAWLPAERTVSASGFSAKWTIPFLGRNYPQAWTSQNLRETILKSAFGVELIDPVDHYRMADRSVKYAALFILLTFASVWLIEVLSDARIHPIQYLLLGAALCVFYLLELSLAEHLGFALAYAIAATSVLGLVTAYSVAILRTAPRAALVGSGVAALYGYLYVLLTNEDYALLIGSIGLFVAVAGVMLLTRRIDWYAPRGPLPHPSS